LFRDVTAVRQEFVSYLGTFANFSKATISSVMFVLLFVRLSLRMEKLGSHWTDFHEI